ncbi:flagellar hook-basal body complex protein [Lacimonas salitolerans]|uniref:Flagellar basal-body rod protein FlgF n=1 Tax=Lacimonas salitolerans TaxID=1323750 RepID=A0ABW4EKQ1_9RHOB
MKRLHVAQRFVKRFSQGQVMDRNIHIALNNMRNIGSELRVNAQNMANMNVPGFRSDLAVTRQAQFVEAFDQFRSRVYSQQVDTSLFSSEPGNLQNTGQDLDVAIRGDGYFFIEPATGGDNALSRRGDLGYDAERFLVDGAGNRVLDTGLAPIQLPQARRIVIQETGQIDLELFGAPEGTLVPGPIIATTLAEDRVLAKSPDGHIRTADGQGVLPQPDQRARLAQGSLENSNVNSIASLVSNIESQRHFEMSVKFIALAQEIDEATSQVMRLPNG